MNKERPDFDAGWARKPIIVTGTSEGDLPARHCGGYEVLYFGRWGTRRGGYACENCGQRFVLRRPRGYERPLGSMYD